MISCARSHSAARKPALTMTMTSRERSHFRAAVNRQASLSFYFETRGLDRPGTRGRRGRPSSDIRADPEFPMKAVIYRFANDQSGATAIEYGLIAALISVVCIAAMTFAGQQLLAVYTRIGNSLAAAL